VIHSECPPDHEYSKALETIVLRSNPSVRGGVRSVRPLIVNDLCAQLAPLDRYGLPRLSAAVADGLRALIGASRNAFCAAAGCDRT
jgi:hypothetical protein